MRALSTVELWLCKYTQCLRKNVHLFIFLNNSVKRKPSLMIFGTLNPEKISHEILQIYTPHLLDVTLGNPKVIFSSIIHTFIVYVITEENKL